MNLRGDNDRKKEILRLRVGLFLGALLFAIFTAADLYMLPPDLHAFYLSSRAQLQGPIIVFAIALSFTRYFYPLRYWLFTFLLLTLTFTNYALIYESWVRYEFSFPYEGTIIYAFYCVFALGIPFRPALVAALISIAGFIGLMVVAPAYSDRVMMASVFVTGSLFTCVFAQYRVGKMVNLLKQSNAKFSSLSRLDALTELLNRRALMIEGERLLSLGKREKIAVAVFMLDLDDFKKYNDAFGHLQGDEAITVQADIMRAVFQRKTDILGRYGGEEFIVIVSGLSTEQVERRCNQLLDRWKEEAMPHAKEAAFPIMSCSIGAAVVTTVTHTRLEALIAEADKALYEAKSAGKATYVLSVLNDISTESE